MMARTIFEMHKFELVGSRVIVTILRQREHEELKDGGTPNDAYLAQA